jgi:hypothetical protein
MDALIWYLLVVVAASAIKSPEMLDMRFRWLSSTRRSIKDSIGQDSLGVLKALFLIESCCHWPKKTTEVLRP